MPAPLSGRNRPRCILTHDRTADGSSASGYADQTELSIWRASTGEPLAGPAASRVAAAPGDSYRCCFTRVGLCRYPRDMGHDARFSKGSSSRLRTPTPTTTTSSSMETSRPEASASSATVVSSSDSTEKGPVSGPSETLGAIPPARAAEIIECLPSHLQLMDPEILAGGLNNVRSRLDTVLSGWMTPSRTETSGARPSCWLRTRILKGPLSKMAISRTTRH